jgi:VWFA-related protein
MHLRAHAAKSCPHLPAAGVRVAWITTLALLVSLGARAQETVPKRQAEPIRVRTDLVVVDAHVLDRKSGAVIDRLDRSHFEVYEDGVPQQITHFSQDQQPLSIVLLLDASASVLPILAEIHEGARRALSRLKPEDQVALGAFGVTSEVIEGFTRDRDVVAERIGTIDRHTAERLGDETYLDEAVFQAVAYARANAPPDSRRVVLVVTDNWSNQPPGRGHSAQQARIALLESGTIASGLVVGEYPLIERALLQGDKSARRQVQRDPLLRMLMDYFATDLSRLRDPMGDYARETAGVALEAAAGDAARRLGELIERVRRMYSFGYVSSNDRRDGSFRNVTVKLSAEGAQRFPGARIVARKGYYAPKL